VFDNKAYGDKKIIFFPDPVLTPCEYSAMFKYKI